MSQINGPYSSSQAYSANPSSPNLAELANNTKHALKHVVDNFSHLLAHPHSVSNPEMLKDSQAAILELHRCIEAGKDLDKAPRNALSDSIRTALSVAENVLSGDIYGE